MPIVETKIISQGRFSDGIHLDVKLTDHVGKEYVISRTLPRGSDIKAFTDQLTNKTDARLVQNELRKIVYESAAPNLIYSTPSQLAEYVRGEYQKAKHPRDRVKVARKIIEWVEDGRFTVNQLRNVFGKSPSEFSEFADKLRALRDADNLLENSESE